ncbi:MAG: hypothetical protein QM734_03960 [Cyclobacteriaceae bacterium]
MTKRIIIPLFFMLAMIGFYSCQQKNDPNLATAYLDLPQTPYQYNSGATNDYIPTLGRVLFYDSRLSANNSISARAVINKQVHFLTIGNSVLAFWDKQHPAILCPFKI